MKLAKFRRLVSSITAKSCRNTKGDVGMSARLTMRARASVPNYIDNMSIGPRDLEISRRFGIMRPRDGLDHSNDLNVGTDIMDTDDPRSVCNGPRGRGGGAEDSPGRHRFIGDFPDEPLATGANNQRPTV